jgi:DNA replication protein DnaC
LLNKTRPQTKRLRLPRLTNDEYDYVEAVARKSGIPLSVCPTCGAKRISVDEDNHGWENGTYLLDGVEYPCDCQAQIELRKHYYLANIGDQYQRLSWDEFYGSADAKDAVNLYLDAWDSAKLNGMGLEFNSPQLGTGKTFCATYVGRELIKRREKVYFMPFLEVIGLLSRGLDYRNSQEDRLRDTTVLILDEVVPAISTAQRQLFGTKFEELIRHRTNYNRPTIMTTNLRPKQLREEYPRSYSLLEAKQIRVEMSGDDARQGDRGLRNIELLKNGEVEPIT